MQTITNIMIALILFCLFELFRDISEFNIMPILKNYGDFIGSIVGLFGIALMIKFESNRHYRLKTDSAKSTVNEICLKLEMDLKSIDKKIKLINIQSNFNNTDDCRSLLNIDTSGIHSFINSRLVNVIGHPNENIIKCLLKINTELNLVTSFVHIFKNDLNRTSTIPKRQRQKAIALTLGNASDEFSQRIINIQIYINQIEAANNF